MDELTRFAQRLIEQLGASGEGALRPVEVAVLRETVLPYRTHRRALGIESVEDYETILLRLIGGERGIVKTVPAQAAQRCRDELAQPNPDLGILDELASATVQITSMAAAQIVGDRADGEDSGDRTDRRADGQTDRPLAPVRAERPPKKQPQSTPQSESPVPSERSASSASSVQSASPAVAVTACPSCSKTAPAGRQVVFCPWCGERLIPFVCSRCHTELDSQWKHCITCGAPVKDPFSFP